MNATCPTGSCGSVPVVSRKRFLISEYLDIALITVTVCVFLCSTAGCGSKVEQITDPKRLANMAIDAKRSDGSFEDGRKAVSKLIRADPTLLPKIAVEANESQIRADAMKYITDPEVLAQIALEDADDNLHNMAYLKLTGMPNTPVPPRDRGLLNDRIPAATSKATDNVSTVLMIHKAYAKLPEKHRERLTEIIWGIVRKLSSPPIKAKIGLVENIQVKWEPRSATYFRVRKPGEGTFEARTEVGGEAFTLSITFSKAHQCISHTWESLFPQTRSDGDNRFQEINERIASEYLKEVQDKM